MSLLRRKRGRASESEVCGHPAFYKNLCVACGALSSSLAPEAFSSPSSLIIGSVGSLQVSEKEAQRIEVSRAETLLKSRRLALVLDIDHTLLHAVLAPPNAPNPPNPSLPSSAAREGRILPLFLEGVLHLVKLRPHLFGFLDALLPLCQMHLYTNGTRPYAELVTALIDPERKYFNLRIASRSDSLHFTGEKYLHKLFLNDTSMVLVMDDREDVWREGRQSKQLILVKPYLYFHEGQKEVNNAAGNTMMMMDGGSNNHSSASINENSNEEEEEARAEEEEEEDDDQLLKATEAIRSLHRSFYAQFDLPLKKLLTTGHLLTALKTSILVDCVFVFFFASGVNRDSRERALVFGRGGAMEVAQSLGAKVVKTYSSSVTHILTTTSVATPSKPPPSASSSEEQLLLPRVVHVDWVLACRYALQRVDEKKYILNEEEAGKIREQSRNSSSQSASSTSSKNNSAVMTERNGAGKEKDEEDDDDDDFLADIESEFEKQRA